MVAFASKWWEAEAESSPSIRNGLFLQIGGFADPFGFIVVRIPTVVIGVGFDDSGGKPLRSGHRASANQAERNEYPCCLKRLQPGTSESSLHR